jgi:hypothetical protein
MATSQNLEVTFLSRMRSFGVTLQVHTGSRAHDAKLVWVPDVL